MIEWIIKNEYGWQFKIRNNLILQKVRRIVRNIIRYCSELLILPKIGHSRKYGLQLRPYKDCKAHFPQG